MRPKTEDRRPKTEDRRPKTEDRRPKTVSRLAEALLFSIFVLLFSADLAKAQTDYTVWAGQTHIQDTDAIFDSLSFDGQTAPTQDAWFQIRNNATITIKKRLSADIPIRQASIVGSGFITTQGRAPLEVYVKNPYVDESHPARLIINSNVRIINDTPLIKTGLGALHFNGTNNTPHQLGAVTINEGIFALGNTKISVTGPITIGPNASFVLQLYNKILTTGQKIIRKGGGLPNLRLRGNSTGEANFTFVKSTNDVPLIQGIDTLYIENRASIGFGNTAPETPIILYLDHLTFNDTDAILRITDWAEGAAYLLVKKTWGNANIAALLSQIYFEGYGRAKNWEAHGLSDFGDYWQITPLPEPTTYGATLGAVGLGLWTWRKRRNGTHRAVVTQNLRP